MDKVVINLDTECEMLEINVNGKQHFIGNVWDFDRPSDIVKLLKKLKVDVELNKKWIYEE